MKNQDFYTTAGSSAEELELLRYLLEEEEFDLSQPQTIPCRKRSGNLPLSFAQHRLWFLAQLDPGNTVYHIFKALRLNGPLNTPALHKSLATIIERHEALRTTIVAKEGIPEQVVLENWNLDIPLMDLRLYPPGRQDAEVQRLLREALQTPFDLSSDLMLRVLLLQLGQEEHILLFVWHHIAFDGWSMDIFLRELSSLYSAFCEGQPSSLPELPIQYADFAVWQQEWKHGDVFQELLSYWKAQLTGAPQVLELPTDRPRPPQQTYQGSRQSLALPKSLSQTLKELSQREGATLFMTLLAAFEVLLYRYTGQADLVVGSPTANRNRIELEGLIGFFVNTVVLRIDLSGNPRFRELLAQVREVALGAYAYQDLPFEKLVEELQVQRNTSHTPLFQVMFALQNTPQQEIEWPNLTVSHVNIEPGTARVDVALVMRESADGLTGSLEYNTDAFDQATIIRMIRHFRIILESIVVDPNQRLSDLPLLTEAERTQILVEWNNTRTDFPQDRGIHQLVEAQAAHTPNAVAVVYGNEHLTYGELNRRANQLAHHLRRLGVGPDVLVGVYMPRSINMVVGLLGILKAGGAYVPLDPVNPRERLSVMLKDLRTSALLTQQAAMAGLPPRAQQGHVICLDSAWPAIAHEDTRNPENAVTVENLAYAIYTSGSTGAPKGTLIPHRGLLNLIFWHHRAFTVTTADRATQVAGVAFDASVWELWPYLAAGACVYLAEPGILSALTSFRDWLVSNRISICFVPTPLAEELIALEWPTELALRIMLTGGDTLHQYPPPALPFILVNNYGPTENSVVSTSGSVFADEQQPLSPPSIGRPIDNTQVYILDQYFQPVPLGVPGELYLESVGLARGYLNRPALTAERFIPNPFGAHPGERLYKSGDQARYLANGCIEFVGRIDQQVKIRGFRIELGEIETILTDHPAVKEAAVVASEAQPGNTRLVAYIVSSNMENAPTSEILRGFLKPKLPDYMIPSVFVLLDVLPLTPNGKVDRNALPAPDLTRGAQENTFVAPQTPVEEILVEVWADVLKLENLGIHDNFFELGGHSLLAVRLHSKIQEIFGQDISVVDIFQYPTIHAFAQYLSRKQTPHVSDEPARDVRAQKRLARRAFMNQHRQSRQKGRNMNSQGEDLDE